MKSFANWLVAAVVAFLCAAQPTEAQNTEFKLAVSGRIVVGERFDVTVAVTEHPYQGISGFGVSVQCFPNQTWVQVDSATHYFNGALFVENMNQAWLPNPYIYAMLNVNECAGDSLVGERLAVLHCTAQQAGSFTLQFSENCGGQGQTSASRWPDCGQICPQRQGVDLVAYAMEADVNLEIVSPSSVNAGDSLDVLVNYSVESGSAGAAQLRYTMAWDSSKFTLDRVDLGDSASAEGWTIDSEKADMFETKLSNTTASYTVVMSGASDWAPATPEPILKFNFTADTEVRQHKFLTVQSSERAFLPPTSMETLAGNAISALEITFTDDKTTVLSLAP